MDIIVIHGSPGSGKTTIAREMHQRLGSPWFEFGWIPEFTKLTPHTHISQRDEEQLSFENVVLVAKNYVRHGYENVILSDLNDVRMLDIPVCFAGYAYVIVTLYSEDDEVIKQRILSRSNGNEFRDWDQAVRLNGLIRARRPLPNEYRIRADNQSPAEIADRICGILGSHQPVSGFIAEEYDRKDYGTYVTEYSDIRSWSHDPPGGSENLREGGRLL